ncbi:MAG: hypothetical protein ACO377_05710, partial [Pseudomonadales bacterium]
LEVLYNHKGRALLRAGARRGTPDLVYERHALHCRAGLDVARELGVPLLLEVNSPMVLEMQRLGLLRLPRRARRTERLVLSEADAVLAVTQVLAPRRAPNRLPPWLKPRVLPCVATARGAKSSP